MLRFVLGLFCLAIVGFATACSDDDDIGASENATETAADTASSPEAEIVDATPAPPPPPPPDAPPPPNEPTNLRFPPIVTIEEPPNNSGGRPNLSVQLKGSAVYSEGGEPLSPSFEWRVKYAGLDISIGETESITWLPSDHVTVQCGSRIVEIVLLVHDAHSLTGQDSIDYEVVSGEVC